MAYYSETCIELLFKCLQSVQTDSPDIEQKEKDIVAFVAHAKQTAIGLLQSHPPMDAETAELMSLMDLAIAEGQNSSEWLIQPGIDMIKKMLAWLDRRNEM